MTADEGHGSEERPPEGERRRNFELRERVTELLELTRRLSRERAELSPDELEDALERIEWLGQEIWRSSAFGPLADRDLTDHSTESPD